jgi:hypothetical protein
MSAVWSLLGLKSGHGADSDNYSHSSLKCRDCDVAIVTEEVGQDRRRRSSRPSSGVAGLALPDQTNGPLPQGLGRWRLPRFRPEKADPHRNIGSDAFHACQTPGGDVLRDEAEW